VYWSHHCRLFVLMGDVNNGRAPKSGVALLQIPAMKLTKGRNNNTVSMISCKITRRYTMQIESTRRQATGCPRSAGSNKDSWDPPAAVRSTLLRACRGVLLTSAPLCELLATPQGAQLCCLFNDTASTQGSWYMMVTEKCNWVKPRKLSR
jgi:hypothetical protein